MNNKIICLVILLVLMSGCAPKMGKIKKMQEVKSRGMAEILIIRNYNYMGGGVRIYPTVNDEKIVGLYSNDYSKFYLDEGKYTFGLLVPDVVFGRWIKENTIIKEVKSRNKYYFLTSPNMIGGMEIEEIAKEEAEERISSSTRIKTGTISETSDPIAKVIRPLAKVMGLDEDDTQVEEKK